MCVPTCQAAEFRGFMEVATVLAKGHSILKQGEGATQGASTALPPAPWHTEIFAQVHTCHLMAFARFTCFFA